MNTKTKIQTHLQNVDWKQFFKEYLTITFGAFLMILSIDIFFVPAKISPGGGVTGSAIIINHFTGLPVGMLMLLLNIPLVIIGFYYLGRFQFLVRTFYTVLIYNLGVDFFATILPTGITHDPLLNAVCGGVLGGIGTGLIFRGRSTTAGLAIVTRVLQLKTGLPISQAYIVTDGVVLLIFGQVFGWDKALYSFLALFIFGLATDYILEGPSVIRTVFIVTNLPEPVSQGLLTRLGVGVTAWSARGMFTQEEHTVLFCSTIRSDAHMLKDIVSEIDPDAFIVIGQGHQASGGVLRQLSGKT
ncbi:MAG TPA: YitT family protein [Anaerolineales bacterium]|nr:YitT family protein [Anaerolineales bacterium]